MLILKLILLLRMDILKMKVELVHSTPEGERLIAYCARVSSEKQDNPDYAKLLSYCIKHKHWSIFEMASMCVEIETSRAIAQQILRHRSFHFQEFSQRYAQAIDKPEFYPARRQDSKNRQNSIDDMSDKDRAWFIRAQQDNWDECYSLYVQALDRGVAKEQARFLLPLSTTTKMYMHGTVRDWIHYLLVRTDKSTQLEHRLIAEECKKIFIKEYPVVAQALEWVDKPKEV